MPTLPPGEVRRRFATAPVAHLATVRPDGSPHLVPITFAVEGDSIYSAVDAKPKTSTALARLRNIESHPQVALLVDAYTGDWSRLWWVRVDGRAHVATDGPEHERALILLRHKYAQYRDPSLAFGDAIVISVDQWSSWTSAGASTRRRP